MMTIETGLIRLLGSVEALSRDGWRRAGPSKQACVLASLALAARTPVGIDVLAHRLWGSEPPAGMRNVIYGHIARLRRLLAGNGLVELRRVGPSEYQLDLASDQVDALRARTLAAEAREEQRHGDTDRAAQRWRLAADLWRGPALAGLRGAWAVRTARKLRDEHVAVLTGLSECELLLGRHEAAVSWLETAVEEHPLAQNLVEALMLGLYRCGRVTDALDRYEDTRRRLREELGNDPGQRLRDLQQRILRQDPRLQRADSGTPPASAAVSVPASAVGIAPASAPAYAPEWAAAPAQLPAALTGFVGRDQEVEVLDSLVSGAGAARFVAISGMAGVGKTALAVHWAHRAAGWFPDGQLYADLRGFDVSDQTADPAEVRRGFLYALGVPPNAIPPGSEAQLGMFRTMLAGKRLLMVLDNARDEEQVRPLLPGAPDCAVLVTSRNRLAGLVTTHGARPVSLGLFSDTEAHQLLRHRIGEARLAAEPAAAAATVAQSGRLPLALAVVAARAATLPELPIGGLLHELRNTRTTLDGFATVDAATDVRAVFSWSYRLLGAPAARLFRLLAVHPGPQISLAAAASLAGIDEQAAQTALAELSGAHLLVEHAPGRYACHDLLRAYAEELAGPAADEQAAAIDRLLDHYAASAHAAALLVDPEQDLGARREPSAGVRPVTPRTPEAAMGWFRAEHSALLAALELAAAEKRDQQAWMLASAVATFLDWQGWWYQLVDTQQTAVAAARRLGDEVAEALAHRQLTRAYCRLRWFQQAERQQTHTLRIYRRLGDLGGLARAHQHAAVLFSLRGRPTESLQAARLARAYGSFAGDEVTLALAYNSMAWTLARLGRYAAAIELGNRALDVSRRTDDREVQASIWDSLGYINRHLDRHAHAVTCYRTAIEMRRALGDRRGEATSLASFGDVAHELGEVHRAVDAWKQALMIYQDLHDPSAESVRAKLEDGPSRSSFSTPPTPPTSPTPPTPPTSAEG